MPLQSKNIKKVLKISRQRLWYWRKAGILTNLERTKGGYFTYNFHDLTVLKTIEALKKEGFSTYKIRKSFLGVKSRFPDEKELLAKGQFIVFGKSVIFVFKGTAYDAISGQVSLLDFSKIEGWVGLVKELPVDQEVPESEESYLKKARLKVS